MGNRCWHEAATHWCLAGERGPCGVAGKCCVKTDTRAGQMAVTRVPRRDRCVGWERSQAPPDPREGQLGKLVEKQGVSPGNVHHVRPVPAWFRGGDKMARLA